jgi:long-chain acyl-CoA synthetase
MNETLKLVNIVEGKPLYRAMEINSLKDMLNKCRVKYGDKIAFKYRHEPKDETVCKTYSEFFDDVNALGSALVKLGLKNSRVAIIGENRYEWVVSYLAAVNGVGIAIPLDRLLPPNEIESLLERGEVDVLVYSNAFSDDIKAIAQRNSRLKALICMNASPEENEDSRFHAFYQLLEQGQQLLKDHYAEYTSIEVDPTGMSVLLFTSGTSSSSKAVMLSHSNICADIMSLGGVVRFEPGESVMSILPMHHTFENTAGLLFPLYLGMTVSISDGLKYINKNLTEYQPHCLVGVPLIFDKFKNRIMEEVKKKGLDKKVQALMKTANAIAHLGIDLRRKIFKKLLEPLGGKLRVIVTGGAAMEPKTAKWFENIGIRVYQGYGLTETAPVVAGGCDRVRKIGTCGQPLPGVKLAIANPSPDGTGEIVVQGKNVMLGYWKNEEATAEALRGGWFHTGDLGKIDRKGLLHVTGRVKSMIVLKNGKKVFPEELESHINELQFVKESLVWGEATADGNVEICSKIVLDKEKILAMVPSPDDESSIRKLLDKAIKDINKLMPVYKTIRYYVFGYEELIKTTSMKVKRYVELDQIRKTLNELAMNIKIITGRNIDKLREMLAKGVESY